MKLAKSNTDKNLETCGVLAGSLKNRKFHVTALIIPKQESTSCTCNTTNEEEIFEVQDTRKLFPLGWIHTHPTQSCFMSSVDVHTHYSYQIMLPEAVAIVMAPTDNSRKHGIFRLTTPGGMSVIRNCQQRGFHSHEQPPDGGLIYKSCTDVYLNPKLKFDVIDLR
jgi:STAM-binding protein